MRSENLRPLHGACGERPDGAITLAIHEALGFPTTGGISLVSWSFIPPAPDGVRKAYRDSFRSAEPQKLKLDLNEPVVQGTFASVKGKGTRSGSLNSSSTFAATLVRQGDKWVIQAGIF